MYYTIEDKIHQDIIDNNDPYSSYLLSPYKIKQLYVWKDIRAIVNKQIKIKGDWLEFLNHSMPFYCESQEALLVVEEEIAEALPIYNWLIRIKALYTNKTPPETMITDEQIQRAKLNPICDIINVNYKKQISCPFHEDKKPSMIINKNNTCKCFSCGFFGDSIALYMKLHNKSFKQSVLELL